MELLWLWPLAGAVMLGGFLAWRTPAGARWASRLLLLATVAAVVGLAHLVARQVDEVRSLGELINSTGHQRLLTQRLSQPGQEREAALRDAEALKTTHARVAAALSGLALTPAELISLEAQVAALTPDVESLAAEVPLGEGRGDVGRTTRLVGGFNALVADIAAHGARTANRVERAVWLSTALVVLVLVLLWVRGAEPLRRRFEQQARERERVALLELMSESTSGGLTAAVPRLTETFARLLECERVGVWLAQGEGPLPCLDLYERSSGHHRIGPAWSLGDVPLYAARVRGRPLVLSGDVERDPDLAGFRALPGTQGVGAQLAVPLWRGERLLGLVVCSHLGGPREWTAEHQSSASTLATLTGLALETERRREVEAALQERMGQLEEARSRAELADRAKSEFLATMSHEIRTPMNGVLGFTALLLEGPLSDEQRSFAHTIHRSGEALLTIIDDILDFSKIEAGRVRLEALAWDVRATVSDAVALLQARASEKGLTLTFEIVDPVPRRVRGDPSRFRQVLLNLLGNAVKFTEAGSVVVRVSHQTSTLQVEVVDTGIGISPEAQGRLFSRFTQADGTTTRRFGGTGLGLAICRSLVELMGGRISLESCAGRGSRFCFTVEAGPVIAPAACDGGPAHAFSRRSFEGVAVLLVEDNPINQRLAEHLLRRLGCRVMTAPNGRVALEVLARTGFDLVLMDCHMPEVDGYEATRRLRTELGLHALPVVALTAEAMNGDRQRCIDAGMNDYLAKPLREAQLRGVLERWSCQPQQVA